MRAIAIAAACALAACGVKGGTPGDGETDGDAPVVLEWDEEDLPYRVTVTLRAHEEKDRTDVPVVARIDHAGMFVMRGVRVHEPGGGEVDAGAWCQPDGRVLEVGFTAGGVTPVGETRTFFVYYDVSASPNEWSWQDGWASFGLTDRDGDSTDDGFRLSGSGYALEREIDESTGVLRPYRRSDTRLEHGSRLVAGGFTTGYQLESPTSTFEAGSAESEPVGSIVSDADGFSAAAAASWMARPEPVSHDLHLTYRVFERWPFMQMVLSAGAPGTYAFSSADWNGRTVYLSDAYDRMVSDTRGDEVLATVWDTSMRWLVVYDEASDGGFGWFIFDRGVVRADEDAGTYSIYDSYGYSAAGTTVFRNLWMHSDDKDEIVDLFDAMAPGVEVSRPESRDLNILEPLEDEYFFPGDVLTVLVSTPGSSGPVTASLLLPDGSSRDVNLEKEGVLWSWADPLVLEASHPVGTWTLAATSAGVTREVSFEFRLPAHPKLMFGPDDLDDIRARKDDPAYAEIWARMLELAGGYESPILDPGPGLDIRGYADRLMTLALVQLVDPSQPFEDLMWEYFFTMLRYTNWDPDSAPFNNHDLTVGHFLTALALTYDWHHDAMTPDARQEVREHLRAMAGAWLSTSWMRIYRDIDWTHYGTVTNNHYWINHQGVAAAAFVLEDEMPESVRGPWVDHLEENLGIILSVLEEDGTSNEGVAYHAYGQMNLFRWLDMRDRSLGGNTATSVPWFAESVLWDLYSIMPGGDDGYGGPANFGDCPTRHYQPPRTIQAWLARRLGNGIAQWSAEELDWPEMTAMSYLWYDPSVPAVAPDTLPAWRLFSHKGMFAWRSSWLDDATYLCLKSGSYFGGHEQPDAGHFILSKAGVPYVTDHGYSYLKMTDEHNLILVGGVGQKGEGTQWMGAVDPVSWASVTHVLADRDFFDVVADPTPMVISTDLDSWTREIVGLGPDIFIVRDAVSASAPVAVDWLLHSYVSEPPASVSRTYTYAEHRLENPFTADAPPHWSIRPQAGADVLNVADASYFSWTSVVEPSSYVPEQDPDTSEYNDTFESFQVGYRLRRTLTSDDVTSLVAMWFGDGISLESWSDETADALCLQDIADVAIVVWPASGSVIGFHGVSVTGLMAGRRIDEPAYFAREVTLFEHGADTLIVASTAVSVFARLEHTGARFAVVQAAALSDLFLSCPEEPSRVLFDGVDTAFTWTGPTLSLTVPAGQHRIDIE